MIQVNDTWAIDADGKCWTILRRSSEEESARGRARLGHTGPPGERTWRPVAYHGRLEDCTAGLLDRMARDAAQSTEYVEGLRILILSAKQQIIDAVRGA